MNDLSQWVCVDPLDHSHIDICRLEQVVNELPKAGSAASTIDVVGLNVEEEGVIFLARNDVLDALSLQVENGFQAIVLHGLKPDGSC